MVLDDFVRIEIPVIRGKVLMNLILLYAVELSTIFMETPRVIPAKSSDEFRLGPTI